LSFISSPFLALKKRVAAESVLIADAKARAL
jgi:hypothetical protein